MTPALLLEAPQAAPCSDELAEPTIDDLEAIEAEWPVIAAELAVVEAQCRFLACPSRLSRRHLRRSHTALARALAAQSHHLIGAFS